MDNELIVEKNWIKRNWKWFLPITLLFLLFLSFIFSSTNAKNLTDITQAYSDNLLYEKAITKANSNPKVIALIGKIDPVDKLAIMEGNVIYTNNNNSVVSTVRFKGSKENGKIDISAHKTGKEWIYKKITIRLKKQKTTIVIL